MSARAYRRSASVGEVSRASGRAPLRSDEVSRHSVRLVWIDRELDQLSITRFANVPQLLRAGDLVVVNDAATLPASLSGRTERDETFELRLSAPVDGNRLYGVVFGAGDHRTRTEHRAAPPPIHVGELVRIGAITARVIAIAGRRIELIVRDTSDALWQALYASGKPIQYAHRAELLPLWAVQTAYAARPWAAEMPSAGRALTWDVLLRLRSFGIGIASLTHAAGLSSTGDDALDRALPWPERYEIPRRTIDAIADAKQRGGRVIAVGTTVVRALEEGPGVGVGGQAGGPGFSSGMPSEARHIPGPVPGSGVATLRLDAGYRPRVVDGLISGLHAPGESHFDLLSAFVPSGRLIRALELAASEGLSSHELGDACLIL